MIVQLHYLNEPLVLIESDVRLDPYDRISVAGEDYVVDSTRFVVLDVKYGSVVAQHVYVSRD